MASKIDTRLAQFEASNREQASNFRQCDMALESVHNRIDGGECCPNGGMVRQFAGRAHDP